MTEQEQIEMKDGVREFFDTINGLIRELDAIGHPIPAENNKTFYLRCCWVLSWLNKVEIASPDNYTHEFRKTLIHLLPLIKESERAQLNALLPRS